MQLEIMGIAINKGMRKNQIESEIQDKFIETSVAEGKYVILRGKKPVEFQGARFRVNIFFTNENIDKVSLVAVATQGNYEYANYENTRELHEKWLRNNYGEPQKIEIYGYQYEYEDMKICSEYDPRSGSTDIFYLFNN